MNSAERFILAVDVGSSFIKAAIICKDGHSLVSRKVPLPAITNGERVEIGVQELWCAFVQSVQAVRSAEGGRCNIAGIGITSQMSGLVLLDDEHRAVRNIILGVDRRGTLYVSLLAQKLGRERIYAHTGCPLTGIYPAAKLLCLAAEEPEAANRIRYLGGIKEYLLWRLTGSWVTDPASASTTQMYDQEQQCWWLQMLQVIGVADIQLPEVRNPDAVAGMLLTEAGRELVLPGDIPVFVGTGDGPAANLTTGSVTEQQLCISLGTTAVTRYLTTSPERMPEEAGYFRQHFGWDLYLQGFRLEGAGSYIREFLPQSEEDGFARKRQMGSFGENNALMQQIYPTGIFFNPLSQRRDRLFIGDPARASITQKLHAVLDGILFTLYDVMKPSLQQQRFREIRPIGGGIVNERWMQEMADLFQLPIIMTEGGDSTLGVAMIVMKSMSGDSTWEETKDRMVRVDKVLKPNIEAQNAMKERYETYMSAVKRGDSC